MPALDRKDFAIVAASVAAGVAAGVAVFRERPRLAGSIVLITGGSRGLGLAMAREFAAQGCRVAICARDKARLDSARQDLERRGADVFAIECDVSEQTQVQEMTERVTSHFGRVDILVNNAGEIQVGPLESMELSDFERSMRVMFWGTVYPTLALLPRFLDGARGPLAPRIVNITSIGGKVAVPHLLPYTCAKFAAVGFSEGLRAELAGRGVKVVTIAPGLMRTGSYLNAFFKGDQHREAIWFSLGAASPGISMGAERAARQIVEAARRGKAEKILTAPANLLAVFHGLFPGLTADLLGLVARVALPKGASKHAAQGRDTRALESRLLTALTTLGRAGARNLQQPV